MAQKITGYIKLQIPAGKATPAPPVGPALGQHGVNIMAFTKEFNERTKNDVGLIIPVVITVKTCQLLVIKVLFSSPMQNPCTWHNYGAILTEMPNDSISHLQRKTLMT